MVKIRFISAQALSMPALSLPVLASLVFGVFVLSGIHEASAQVQIGAALNTISGPAPGPSIIGIVPPLAPLPLVTPGLCCAVSAPVPVSAPAAVPAAAARNSETDEQ